MSGAGEIRDTGAEWERALLALCSRCIFAIPPGSHWTCGHDAAEHCNIVYEREPEGDTGARCGLEGRRFVCHQDWHEA